MRMNWHLWSGVYRLPDGQQSEYLGYPTVVVDMSLDDWALPFSIHAGGPLLGRPGFTAGIGPVRIGWSKL